ncbi:hypothetical protein [Taibaiella koreensis]|uniref:hypothetical protein n=1 Tax=Taibaiella koreensis TaxID=1268548 RepID=UPI000E59B15D|nr:hypothetical protein [Taibaiella koreensis]
MQKIYSLLLMLLIFTSCTKSSKTEHYIVLFQKPTIESIRIKIGDSYYDFNGTEFKQEIEVKWPKTLQAETDILNNYRDEIRIALYDNKDKYIGDVKGIGHVALSATNYEIFYRSPDPNGTGSLSHLCGAPTQNGTPCKRRVSGTTGRCWQHR